MGNLYVSKDTRKLFAFPHVGGSYSGTGDLFASCIAAGKCRGDGIPELIQLSGTFLEQAIKDSAEENVPYPDGTNYEKYLYMLIKNRVLHSEKIRQVSPLIKDGYAYF